MIVKRLVCLANSRKIAGRCVAGKEYGRGMPARWVRPIGHGAHEEVGDRERRYNDGSEPRLLDVMDLLLLEHRPRTYQQENWLLDPRERWMRMGRVGWRDLGNLADNPTQLWVNGHSTVNGTNDQIPLAVADGLRSSLALIHVDALQLHVFAPGAAFSNFKRRVQALFAYGPDRYALWVTDPVIEQSYLAAKDGRYALGEAYLCVSLSEPHKGNCYKLVVAVITADIAGAI